MITTLWILILIAIILLAVIAFVLYKYRGKKHNPDYYSFFIMGIIFLVIGIIIDFTVFWILGLVYMAIGLANKDKWKKNRLTWKNMSEKEKRLKIAILTVLSILVLVGTVVYFLVNNQIIVIDKEKISNFEECAAAGYPVMESYPRQCRTSDGKLFVEVINTAISPEVVDYFYDKFFDKAIDLSGGRMPIEGFTPRMYIDIFSGLKKEDFNNVEAIGGIWEYTNGQLIFVNSNDGGPITSADGTVNKIGMESLLKNLIQRLGIKLENMSDIDNLITFLSQESVQYFCTPEQKKAEACIEIYQPVCGWSDPDKIQCIKFPCASTYSNSCFACKNSDVLYWTNEVCPE